MKRRRHVSGDHLQPVLRRAEHGSDRHRVEQDKIGTGNRLSGELLTPNTPFDKWPELLNVRQLRSVTGMGRSAAFNYARAVGIRLGRRMLRVPKRVLR
jgi:hypothetical protein